VFKKIIVFLTFVFALSYGHTASMRAKAPDGEITVSDQKCTNQAILARIPREVHDQILTAEVILNKQKYAACWHGMPQGVHLLYEDGDEGMVPYQMFKPVDTI